MTKKQYCEQNNVEMDRVFDMVFGEGGGILPTASAFTGYIAEIKEDCLVCTNDKLGVFNKKILIV